MTFQPRVVYSRVRPRRSSIRRVARPASIVREARRGPSASERIARRRCSSVSIVRSWRVLVVDLQGGVLDLELVVQQSLERVADLMAVVAARRPGRAPRGRGSRR